MNWWELDDWSELGSLGEGTGQLYGIENLDLLQEGFEYIYSQDINEPAAEELVGPNYMDSSSYQQEKLYRDQYAQSIDAFMTNKDSAAAGLSKNLESSSRAVGRSGFAGGGRAQDAIESMKDKYALKSDIAFDKMEAAKLSTTESIYNVRKSFVDKLWSDYSMFQATGDPSYDPDWDWFASEYSPNPLQDWDSSEWEDETLIPDLDIDPSFPTEDDTPQCPEGSYWDGTTCVAFEGEGDINFDIDPSFPTTSQCGPEEYWNDATSSCHPLPGFENTFCETGLLYNPVTGECVPEGEIELAIGP